MLNMAMVFLLTALAFGLVISLMAVGVMLGRREIKGSCGGLGSSASASGGSSCSMCSNPDAACRELGRGRSTSQGVGPAVDGSLGGDGEDERRKECSDEDQHRGAASPIGCDRQCETNGCSDEEIEACNRP